MPSDITKEQRDEARDALDHMVTCGGAITAMERGEPLEDTMRILIDDSAALEAAEAKADDAEWMLSKVVEILIAGAEDGRDITAGTIRDVKVYVRANLATRGRGELSFIDDCIKEFGDTDAKE